MILVFLAIGALYAGVDSAARGRPSHLKAATPRAVDATAATGNTRLMSLRRAGVLSSSEVSAGTAA